MLMPVALAIIMRIISAFGPATVAAMTAGMRIEFVAVIPLIALGASLVPFVGQNWGAGKPERARQAYRLSVRAALGWGALCLLGLSILAEEIAPLFSEDPAVLPWLAMVLSIVPVAYGFRGVMMASTQTMNAINRPFDAAALTLLRLFALQWPLALLGAWLYGFPGVLLGMIATDVFAAFVAMGWLTRLLRPRPGGPTAQGSGSKP